MTTIQYLVQTSDEKLHAYFRRDILLADLALNPDANTVKLYKLTTSNFTISYTPCTAAELRAEALQERSLEILKSANEATVEHISPCDDERCEACCDHEFDPQEGLTCINCGAQGELSDIHDEDYGKER